VKLRKIERADRSVEVEISDPGEGGKRVVVPTVRLANSKARIKPTAPLSAFNKENLMEFSLNSLLLIYFTTVAMHLLFYCLHVTLVM